MKKLIPFLLVLLAYVPCSLAQNLVIQNINTTDAIIYDINLNWTGPAGDTVGIYYSSDNGLHYTFIDEAVTKANGSGQFLVFTDTLNNTTAGKLKVANIHNPMLAAVSNTFILHRAIVTYNIAANTILHPGQIFQLSIAVQSLIPCSIVELFFSKDDGYTWQLVTAGNASTFSNFNWTVPSITSHHCRFGFWNGWNMQYMQSARFTIVNPANPFGEDLTITYPRGGEVLNAGEPLTVTWDTTALASRTVGIMVRESEPPYLTNCLIGMANSRDGQALIKVPYFVGSRYEIYMYSMNSGTPLMATASQGRFQIKAPYRINGHFLDIIPPSNLTVPAGSNVTFNWNSYPGLNRVGISRTFPNTNIPPVNANLNNLTNMGTTTFTAPNQAGVDIVVLLTPYITTGSMQSSSCAEKYSITFHTTAVTGVEDVEINPEISISPNPTRSVFRILNTKTGQRISVCNVLGTEIYHQDGVDSHSVQIDLSPFPAGIYFVKAFEAGQIISRKLIKE